MRQKKRRLKQRLLLNNQRILAYALKAEVYKDIKSRCINVSALYHGVI